MTLEERVKFIQRVEQEYPVQEWRANGLYVWPLFRTMFIQASSKRNNSKSKQAIWPLLKSTIRSIIPWFRLLRSQPNTLCVSGNNCFEKYDGKSYHKFFETQLNDGAGYIEYQSKGVRSGAVEFLFPSALWTRLIAPGISIKWENDNSLDTFLNTESENLPTDYQFFLSRTFLDSKIIQVEANRVYWKKVLKRVQPDKVLIISYYNYNFYGMIAACKDLNIETIDIQHGLQGSHHLAYGSFVKVPRSGYEVLPEKFWCWNEYYANQVNEWANGTDHNAYVAGHPWIDFIQKNFQNQAANKTLILFTAQPYVVEVAFSEYVINTLKKANEYGEVYIRLHPSQEAIRQEIIEYLNKNNVDLNIIKLGSSEDESLPVLLSQSLLHITLCSSVVIEADLFDVDSIVLSKDALSNLSHYVDKDRAVLCEDINSVVRLLDNKLNRAA